MAGETSLGDVFEVGERIEETCRLLSAANAVGVWGNHDYGLCSAPTAAEQARFTPAAIGFLTTLRPRLELEDCYFAHVEPWLDPEDIADLWYFSGPPDGQHNLDRIFDAVPHRVAFAGHYHRWLLAAPDGLLEWRGERDIILSPERRYFAVIGALCEGRYAIYDTASGLLRPCQAP